MPRYRLLRGARRDIDAISDYIAFELHNVAAARRLLNRFLDVFAFLAEQPGAGVAVSDLHPRFPDLRRFPVGNYLVYYRPVDGGIEIVRVLYARRDLPGAFPEGLEE